MFLIKTSPRAFFVALIPVAVFHLIVVGMALLGFLGKGAQSEFPTPDRVLAFLLIPVAIDGVSLALGHFALRYLGIAQRAAYGAMGALAAVMGYLIALDNQFLMIAPPDGAALAFSFVPLATGAVAGFLYSQFAGRERVEGHTESVDGESVAPTLQAYEGPIQVRTSFASMSLAALTPAVLMSVVAIWFAGSSVVDIGAVGGGFIEPWGAAILLGMPAQIFISSVIVGFVPTLVFVLIVHGIARAMHRTTGIAYAAIGGLTGLSLGSIFIFTGAQIFIVVCAIFGAICAAIYRRFAGVEPLSLPEAVLVSETEALVPADHPSRKSHTVVLNG